MPGSSQEASMLGRRVNGCAAALLGAGTFLAVLVALTSSSGQKGRNQSRLSFKEMEWQHVDGSTWRETWDNFEEGVEGKRGEDPGQEWPNEAYGEADGEGGEGALNERLIQEEKERTEGGAERERIGEHKYGKMEDEGIDVKVDDEVGTGGFGRGIWLDETHEEKVRRVEALMAAEEKEDEVEEETWEVEDGRWQGENFLEPFISKEESVEGGSGGKRETAPPVQFEEGSKRSDESRAVAYKRKGRLTKPQTDADIFATKSARSTNSRTGSSGSDIGVINYDTKQKTSAFWRALAAERLAKGLVGGRSLNESLEKAQGYGGTWRSAYVRTQEVDIRVEACRTAVESPANQNTDRLPVSRIANLTRAGLRTLVVLPRLGLGNSLRNYVSSFVLAKLTGRRLVLFHGGEHTRVFDNLCGAFHCAADAIHWEHYGTPKQALKQLKKLNPFTLVPTAKGKISLKAVRPSAPVVVTNSSRFFDDYWLKNKLLQACVFSAFKCQDVWCVYSRAMHSLLLKGARESLVSLVEESIGRAPQSAAEGPLPQLSGTPTPRDADLTFDIAINFKTPPRVDESTCKPAACQEAIQALERKYTDDALWRCVFTVMIKAVEHNLPLQRRQGLGSSPLNVFLAADNAVLRAVLVRKLQTVGNVYYVIPRKHSAEAEFMGLVSLTGFYMLSKAHVLLVAGENVNIFSYFAGLAGNGTMAAVLLQNGACGMRYGHRGAISAAS